MHLARARTVGIDTSSIEAGDAYLKWWGMAETPGEGRQPPGGEARNRPSSSGSAGGARPGPSWAGAAAAPGRAEAPDDEADAELYHRTLYLYNQPDPELEVVQLERRQGPRDHRVEVQQVRPCLATNLLLF